MMDDTLKSIVQSAKYYYDNYSCQYAERVLLPLRHFKPTIWATTQTGPGRMDRIFFGLLKNGGTSRKEIANLLGVDEDEFIFSHLDELVRAGYVVFTDSKYQLTQEGQNFEDGHAKEDYLEKMEFSFIWGDMSQKIEIGLESIVTAKQKDVRRKLNHLKSTNEDTLLSALVPHFNEDIKSRENGLVFYDVDSSGRQFPHERVYAEYLAVFYESSSEDSNDLLVELRMYDNIDKNFNPCSKNLIQTANEEEYWQKQFEEIFEEYCKN